LVRIPLINYGPLQAGDLILGTVKSVKPYGAFVDLGGGVTGMLHKSDISSGWVDIVGEILCSDDKIKVGLLLRFSNSFSILPL
jgi:small subunit ribosomal protein S1